jgi:hypothetical protein
LWFTARVLRPEVILGRPADEISRRSSNLLPSMSDGRNSGKSQNQSWSKEGLAIPAGTLGRKPAAGTYPSDLTRAWERGIISAELLAPWPVTPVGPLKSADPSNAKARFQMNIQQAGALSTERLPQFQILSKLPQTATEDGYTIVLRSDGPYTSKFTIQTSTGERWSGQTFCEPFKDTSAKLDMALALQEVWMLEKIRGMIDARGIHLSLNVGAQWVLYQDKQQYVISDRSNLTIILWQEGHDQKEKNAGSSKSTGRRPAKSARLGRGQTPRLAARARAA